MNLNIADSILDITFTSLMEQKSDESQIHKGKWKLLEYLCESLIEID